ncbi:MAG: KamA family radical SAM protein [Acidobacteriota bacterium]
MSDPLASLISSEALSFLETKSARHPAWSRGRREAAMLDSPAPSSPPSGRSSYFPEATDEQWNDWRWQYRNRIKDLETLHRLLPYSKSEYQQLKLLSPSLHVGIPPYYLSLIDPSDPEDPVRKQAVPSILEYTYRSVGIDDPLGEDADMPVEGLVHRYPDRCLFIATNMCPMYCRHCTRRREWEDGELPKNRQQLDAMIDYIRRTPQIRDVIFSGGDPLSLPLPVLDYCLTELRKIPHVEIIRIGTRFPVVLPQRITDELVGVLGKHLPVWMNTHFNHPNELTPEAAAACRKVLSAGIPVNNQSVLMRGVNDNAQTMLRLCHGLLKMGVRPYYLFQCDPIHGAEHLRTSVWTGVEIIEKMRGWTSGLAIPTFVVDTEGGGKVPITSNYIMYATEDTLVLRNYEGKIFPYRNPAPATRSKPRRPAAQAAQGRSNRATRPHLAQLRFTPDANRPDV